MDIKGYNAPGKKLLQGKVVSPSAPRELDGTYWGYNVRMASSIKAIFDDAPYKGGYDLKIGTSERGNLSVDDQNFLKNFLDKVKSVSSSEKGLGSSSSSSAAAGPAGQAEPATTTSSSSFQHAVIVFGGVAGIEECIDADETIGISGNNSSSLFDLWINICEYQGSRTIRTEEAVLIGLSRLCPYLFPIIHQEDDVINGNQTKVITTSTSTSTSTAAVTNQSISPNSIPIVQFSDDDPSEEESSSDDE
jgi:predicted SPOUT superfamily RNA methylase MTH1